MSDTTASPPPEPAGLPTTASAAEDRLASILDIPVTLTVVLGEQEMPLGKLYSLGRGAVIELDKRVGQPVEIFVNDRLVALGEVQVSDAGRLSVAMTALASTSNA